MPTFRGDNRWALHDAAQAGDLQQLLRVVNSGIEVNAEKYGRTALTLAAQEGHAACVNALFGGRG
jgi:hypothetical protein